MDEAIVEQKQKQTKRTPSSAYWRKNKSAVKEIELVELLRSMNRLCGQFDEQTQVSWSRNRGEVGSQNGDNIRLSPELVLTKDTFPAPPEVVDTLAGVALHEIGHKLINSSEVRPRDNRDSHIFNMVASICEDYVIDHSDVLGSTAKSYIHRSRETYLSQMMDKAVETGDTLTDGVNGATGLLLYQYPIPLSNDTAQQIMTIIVEAAKEVVRLSDTPLDRRFKYDSAEAAIRDLLGNEHKRQVSQETRGQGLPQSTKRHMTKDRILDSIERATSSEVLKGLNDGQPLPGELGEKVDYALATEATDVTDFISSSVQKATGLQMHRPMPTVVSRRANDPHKFFSAMQALVYELQWLKMLKEQKEEVTVKAQESGKLDTMRVWRAGIDGRVFKDSRKKKDKPNQNWLLMDNSSSMKEGNKSTLYNIAASVHAVLPDSRVYMYDTTGGHPNITRVDCNGRTAHPDRLHFGNTPSGEALVYIAELLQREGGGRLFHFTDGEANGRVSVPDALTTIEKNCKDVTVVNTVWVGQGSKFIPEEAGYSFHSSVRIASPEEFSELIKQRILEAVK